MDVDGLFTVTLDGGRPWGLRLQGGYEYAQRIRVAKVGTNRYVAADVTSVYVIFSFLMLYAVGTSARE